MNKRIKKKYKKLFHETEIELDGYRKLVKQLYGAREIWKDNYQYTRTPHLFHYDGEFEYDKVENMPPRWRRVYKLMGEESKRNCQ